jgi:hypothetical protein
MIRLATLLAVALAPVASAADLVIEGKWSVTKIENPHQQGSMKLDQGTITVEIHGTAMTTTEALDPAGKPTTQTRTIAIKEAGERKVVVAVTGGDDPPETGTFTPESERGGLVYTTEDSILHLEPYSAEAAAKADAKHADERKPAAPIGEHPITGRFAGAAWTATYGRRSSFQFEEEAGVRCELLAEKPKDAMAQTQQLILVIPKKVGTYPLGPERSATFFVPPGKNRVASHGQIVVEKVEGDLVTFGISVRSDQDNELDGKMTVDLGETAKP